MPAAERARPPLRAGAPGPPGGRVVVVPLFAAGDRIDGFLQRHGGVPDRSRSEWQRLIGLEAVQLNGLPTKPSQRVLEGDEVQIAAVSSQIDLPPEDKVPFEVVYEDPSLVVVDKPAGVVVHPAPGNQRGTPGNGRRAR